MTTAAPRKHTAQAPLTSCVHLRSGKQRAYVEIRLRRTHLQYCLDCAAEYYEKFEKPSLAGIYAHVLGARRDKARRLI